MRSKPACLYWTADCFFLKTFSYKGFSFSKKTIKYYIYKESNLNKCNLYYLKIFVQKWNMLNSTRIKLTHSFIYFYFESLLFLNLKVNLAYFLIIFFLNSRLLKLLLIWENDIVFQLNLNKLKFGLKLISYFYFI